MLNIEQTTIGDNTILLFFAFCMISFCLINRILLYPVT